MIFDISFYFILLVGIIALSLAIVITDNVNRSIFIFLGIICIVIPILIICYYYYCRPNLKVHKPTDSEWNDLLKKTCWHITYEEHIKNIDKGNNNIYLKTKKSLSANIAVILRPSVYFFIGEPDKEQLIRNDIDKNRNYVIYVDIKDLDRNKVMIRKYDNVLIYIGPYHGKGKIRNYTQD
nr:hypothetical protein [Clostridium botulinum]